MPGPAKPAFAATSLTETAFTNRWMRERHGRIQDFGKRGPSDALRWTQRTLTLLMSPRWVTCLAQIRSAASIALLTAERIGPKSFIRTRTPAALISHWIPRTPT